MKHPALYGILACAILGGMYYFWYSQQPTISTITTQIANPASTNCVNKGGRLSIKSRGDGGQYGVCAFEDNRWCEEWALFRGDCPVGGRKIIGYDTEDQMYCAMLGGTTIADPNATCTLPNRKICPNKDLFAGKCD